VAKQLTHAAVLRLRPGPQRREIRDGGCPGLYLIVQPSGVKSWALRFRRPSGQSAKVTLGPLDLSGHEAEAEPVIGAPLSLASARRLAAELHRQRALGKDVAAVRRREKLERRVRGSNTFALAARDFIEQHAIRKQRRWQQTARTLGWLPADDGLELIPKSLSDRWRDRPLAEIGGDDIHFLIDEVREHGIPGLKVRHDRSESRARQVYAVISALFTWLVAKRRLAVNPCIGLHRPEIPQSRDRTLSDVEIAKFWPAAEALPMPYGQILQLLLLTGGRLREVSEMRRAELSDAGAVWEIPPSRTKNKRRHVIQLPSLARAILASVPGDSELVFTLGGDRPIASFSRVKNQLDAMLGIAPWRIHDLRRSCATGLAQLGIAPHVIEAALNHASGFRGGEAGVYNRATYAAERKVALERWADRIQALVSGEAGKVIPFGRA
jgi:integrase